MHYPEQQIHIMENILPVPHGSPITIHDILTYVPYRHAPYDSPERKNPANTLFIVYKDDTNKKRVKTIVDPTMTIFFTKPEFRDDFTTAREYIDVSKVYSKTIYAKNILSEIYREAVADKRESSKRFVRSYLNAVRTGHWRTKKEILKWPHVFLADIDIDDYYRIMLGYNYDTNKNHEITKCYGDIESDIYGLTTSEQNENLDKTNAVTLIFGQWKGDMHPHVFTLLLRDYERYPQQKYFAEHLDEFYQQCHKEFDRIAVTKKNKTQYIETNAKYKILFFDHEKDLLQTVFKLINTEKPDFCGFWNIAYDMPKMKARMEYNGLDPMEIMCDTDVFDPEKLFMEFHIDTRSGIQTADKKTYIKMTSTTRYIDQMVTYANLRKGRKAYGSDKLDNIAEIELGIHKRSFKKGIDVTNAAIKDYWNFVLYNINDVWLQYLIDMVTSDCYSLFVDSNQSLCSIENLSKQVRYNRQIYYFNYLKYNVVPGSNINVDYSSENMAELDPDTMIELRKARARREKYDRMLAEGLLDETTSINDIEVDDSDIFDEIIGNVDDVYCDSPTRKLKLQGAVVGHPNLNSQNGMELVQGIKSKHMHRDCMDMDYASEYPWAKYTRSISRSTQHGRLIIPKKISERQNEYNFENYIPGAEFTSDYISQDILSFGNVWFNLPSMTELAELIQNDDITKVNDRLDKELDGYERNENGFIILHEKTSV